jgi:hypothetical protein
MESQKENVIVLPDKQEQEMLGESDSNQISSMQIFYNKIKDINWWGDFMKYADCLEKVAIQAEFVRRSALITVDNNEFRDDPDPGMREAVVGSRNDFKLAVEDLFKDTKKMHDQLRKLLRSLDK